MSYCVNCGVELGDGCKCCPLCGTPVFNPNETAKKDTVPFFPTRKEQIPEVSKRGPALVISSMLASVAISCGLLNLFLKPDYPWALYAVGAAIMLWIFFVPPLIWRKIPYLLRVFGNMCAMAIYVLMIALASGGMDWYLKLALPVLLTAAGLGLLTCWMFRNHSRLSSLIISLLSLGFLSLAGEFFGDFYLYERWLPGWSLIVGAVTLGLAVPFVVIRLVPSFREEARRVFHL